VRDYIVHLSGNPRAFLKNEAVHLAGGDCSAMLAEQPASRLSEPPELRRDNQRCERHSICDGVTVLGDSPKP
jgi:hypothetical protein